MKIFETIPAKLDNTSYDIKIGENINNTILESIRINTKNNKIMIVCDEYFEKSIGEKTKVLLVNSDFIVYTHYLKAGKGNKNIHEVLKIYAKLEENNFARDSIIIAIGGGVIGDLVGFIASTWLRGMKLIHVPTTLMAMVDSSVGGKVAINFRKTINAIGNYYHPLSNHMDLNTIKTLSNRDYSSGLAEVIKCAIINDSIFFNYLKNNHLNILQKDSKIMTYFISKTIQIKINHVNGDLRESGKRLLLNYGHTLGHAIEISTEKNHQEQLRHGEGVSLGIVAVAYVAQKYFNISNHLINEYTSILGLYSLPTYISAKELGFNREQLLFKCYQTVQKDKKRLNNNIRLILSEDIGSAKVVEDVPFELIKEAFQYVIKE